MTKARAVFLGPLVFVLLGAPRPSLAQAAQETLSEGGTEIAGVVADEQGRPLRGATVSIFASGTETRGRTAVTDELGRFRVESLAPGLYRLRAYLSGFFPSRYAKVVIEEGTEEVGAILMRLASLESMDDFVAETDETRTLAELRWLIQHEERNVLKDEERTISVAELASWDELPPTAAIRPVLPVSGEVGVRAAAYDEGLDLFPGAGAGLDARLAYARLVIPTREDARWLVSAQLLESSLSSWAGSAEYASGDVSGHRLAAGVTYGNYLYGDLQGFRPPEAALTRPIGDRSREWFGSAYASDDFTFGAAAISTGLAYDYFDYLDHAGYVSPRAAVAVPLGGPDGGTALRASAEFRVQAPGGEDLGLLSQMAFDVYGPSRARSSVRAQRTARLQLGLDRRIGEGRVVTVRLFEERSTDQLLKAYVKDRPSVAGGPGYFAVSNQGDFLSRGLGLSVSQTFGAVQGSIGYTFGLAEALAIESAGSPATAEEIHDVTTTVATSIDRTQTRLQAAYRLIAHPKLSQERPGFTAGTALDSRFSVQVYQLLPFVGWNGTSWELMIAVRNLFYEDLENASLLDELAVVDAPRRVLGGVTVRF